MAPEHETAEDSSKTASLSVADLKLNTKASPEILKGQYSSLVSLGLGVHETTVDFMQIDMSTIDTDAMTADVYLVARIVLANSNVASVAGLFNRQVERIEAAESERASLAPAE